MSLIEYLDRTGKHVNAKTLEKYKDENATIQSGRHYLIYETYRKTEETD